MPADPNRVRDVFLAAVELPPDQRPSYLAEACGGDAELRAEVDRLLVANAEPDSILEPASPATEASDPDAARPTEQATATHGPDGATGTFAQPDPDATMATASAIPAPRAARVSTGEGIGTVIAGRYTLIEVIGEGGMGSVYLASQTEPVKRQVALKLIKTGMDSRGVLARFDAERQALALMDHPNIARIYDGGLTPAGQPFFVMELVRGVPLNEYCDQKRLTVTARLELFVAVCQAVQHAHQKGIIHRDLKPGNVLVIEVDGRPTPKVIDFGVAKATKLKLTDMSFADTGAIVGTPAYMSPEQADPTSMDIDTRTDVYALGVMLYELLTGAPPIDASQFKRGALLEMLRMVREVDPSKPSDKVSTADALPSIAANRGIDPGQLRRALTGDLDWIVMKALEKDRTRRYETANGFGADILRHLASEPVLAAPPSRSYRMRKFVRKHRGGVIAASSVLLALIAGVVGTTLGLIQADARRREAETNLAYATKGNEILVSIFEGLDPEEANYTTVGELRNALRDNLNKAIQELDGATVGDPLIVARMQIKLGRTLTTLGEVDKAILVLKRSAETRKAKLGAGHPDTLESMFRLASAYDQAGKLDLALSLHEQTLEIKKARLGPDHNDSLASMNALALTYYHAGKLDMAIRLHEETFKIQKARLGATDPDTLISMNNLALAYDDAGRLDLALPLSEETLKIRKVVLGADHVHTLASMNNLAGVYDRAGKPDLALPLYVDTFKLCKTKLGLDHRYTLLSMSNLARAYDRDGQLDLALPLLVETLRLQKAKLGPEDSITLSAMSNLGSALLRTKAFVEAEPLLREALTLSEKTHPADWTTFNRQSMLGGAILGQKRYVEAEPLLLNGYEGMKQREKSISPQGNTRIPEALDRLIEFSTATNKPVEVKKWQAERAKYHEVAPPQGEKKKPSSIAFARGVIVDPKNWTTG